MKKLIIFFFVLFSIVSFSYISYEPIKPDIDSKGLSISAFTSNFDGVGIELSYYDYNSLFIENTIFNRTIRLKTGESLFKAFVDIPIYNEKFSLGYEYKIENQLFGVVNIKNLQRIEVQQNNYSIHNLSLAEFNIPTYALGNLIFLKLNDFNYFKLTSLLYRPLQIPISIGYSNGFHIDIPLVNFDNYYLDSLDIGISYIEENFYPNITFSFPANIFEQNLHIGARFAVGQDIFYEFYVFNKNLQFPLLVTLNNKGGGIFIEF